MAPTSSTGVSSRSRPVMTHQDGISPSKLVDAVASARLTSGAGTGPQTGGSGR